MRRIAVHRLITIESSVIEMAVVELKDGVVTRWLPLDGEQAMTEWVGGEGRLFTTKDNRIQLLINNKKLC